MDVEQLPRALSDERLVLNCLLGFPYCVDGVLRTLHARDFTTAQNIATYRAIAAQHARGIDIDGILVASEIKDDPAFQDKSYTATDYLIQLAQLTCNGSNAQEYAKRVREASRKRRLLMIGESIVDGAANGQVSHDVFQNAWADFDNYRRDTISGESLLSDAMPVGRFVQQEHETKYLINNVLTAGQSAVVSARAKSLKTSIAVGDAFLSMATGTRFLNYFDVPEPIKCGVISAESGPATISELFKRVAASKGIDARDIDNCIVSTRCPRLRSTEWQQEIRRFIEDNELQALAIDPTYLAMAGVDQNNLASMGQELAPVTDIISETGCSIVMVNHNRKITAAPYGCPTLEEISGSGFAEWARCWLLLNKRREWDEETGRHWLWFVSGGSAGFGSRKWVDVTEGKPSDYGGRVWQVQVTSAIEGQKQEQQSKIDARAVEAQQQLNEDREAVFKLMRKHPSGKSKTFIRDHSGISSRRWPDAFAAMYEAGELVECEVTVSNQKTPKQGYRLSQ